MYRFAKANDSVKVISVGLASQHVAGSECDDNSTWQAETFEAIPQGTGTAGIDWELQYIGSNAVAVAL